MKYLKLIFTYFCSLHLLLKAVKLKKSVLFSTAFYVREYDDIEEMWLMPELHFLKHGMYELRNPHPLFDTKYYIDQVAPSFSFRIDPITHFRKTGVLQGFNPHPLFNTRYYSRNCPLPGSANPLEHYLSGNPPQGSEPNPLFFASDYNKTCNTNNTNDPPLLQYIYDSHKDIQPFSYKSLEEVNQKQGFECYIERFSTFQGVLFIAGWGFAPEKSISKIGHLNLSGSINYLPWPGLPSDDLTDRFGTGAENSRFELKLVDDLPENHLDIVLVFQFMDGSVAYAFNLERYGLDERPHEHFVNDIYIKMLRDDPSPAKILEIGSRDRSGFVSKDHFVPEWFDYTGTDIMAGENVDIICDAHEISSFFPEESFNYVYSINVFEHILIPWKVVLEINKILKPGGKVMIFTHQTMPLHDTPSDYWRFSDRAWQALFCRDTGFKITYSGMGEPVDIVAQKAHSGNYSLSLAPAFLHSMVIAEKIGEPTVKWDVNIRNFEDAYPKTYG